MFYLFIIVILARTATDVSFKFVMNTMTFDSVSSVGKNGLAGLKHPMTWIGLCFGTLNFVVWTMVLEHYDLSFAYPFLSISYVTIMLMGALLFKEKLDAYKLAGLAFIACGAFILFI